MVVEINYYTFDNLNYTLQLDHGILDIPRYKLSRYPIKPIITLIELNILYILNII